MSVEPRSVRRSRGRPLCGGSEVVARNGNDLAAVRARFDARRRHKLSRRIPEDLWHDAFALLAKYVDSFSFAQRPSPSRLAQDSLALRPVCLQTHLEWADVPEASARAVVRIDRSGSYQPKRQSFEWNFHPLALAAFARRTE